jgi:hypothetical protein
MWSDVRCEKECDKIMKKYKNKYKNTATCPRQMHNVGHGLYEAEFKVDGNIPESLKIGLFCKETTFKALVRLSSTLELHDSSKNSFALGLGLLDDKNLSQIHNFTFVQDLHFIDKLSLDMFVKLTLAIFMPFLQWVVLMAHHLGFVFDATVRMRKQETLRDLNFVAILPFAIGPSINVTSEEDLDAVKYMLRSTCTPEDRKSVLINTTTNTHLRDEFSTYLAVGGVVKYDFCIQQRTDKNEMELRCGSKPWKSEWIKVATLVFSKQDAKVNTDTWKKMEENISFSVSVSHALHKPIGDANKLRAMLYDQASNFRHGKTNTNIIET